MMIKNMVPVTKLIATFAFSFWAIVFIRAATNRRYWDDY